MNTFPYAKAVAIMSLDENARYTVEVWGERSTAFGSYWLATLSHTDPITYFRKEG